MIKANVTTEEVKRAVTSRIIAGMYPSGRQVPSVREMAQHLGANRNTVNKAYRALEQLGILESQSGRKSFIVAKVPKADGVVHHFRQQALDVIWQAMGAGLSRQHVLDDLVSIVNQVYGIDAVTITFLECNMHDSAALGSALTQLVGIPVEPGLLDDLASGAAELAQRYDLIVTTFHHLAEVDRVFSPFCDNVVGVDTRLSTDVLHELARLPATRFGVICGVENTIQKLRHIICSYHAGSVIESALIDHEDDVRAVGEHCDRLVVTHSCVERVVGLTRRQPDVVVEFRIDEQSVTLLKQRVQEIRQRRRSLT